MIEKVREMLGKAQRVAVLTGAGISAESGIPTFRGPGGLWKQYRPEELATPEAFARDPLLVWEWYDWRRGLVAEAQPNPGHIALKVLEDRTPSFALITQNVDGLHERAGSRNVIPLHGDLWTLRCIACGRSTQNRQPHLPQLPPFCECGGMQRPGVVWFGEALPQDQWEKALDATGHSDLFLVVGTAAVVMPAGGLIRIAQSKGASVIEINAEETWFSASANLALRGPAGTILPQLLEQQ